MTTQPKPSAISTALTNSFPATQRAIPDALRNFDLLPNSANVRQKVVEGLFSCSPATVWRNVKKGIIPAPKKLSERVTAWNVGQLRAALAERGL